MSQPQPTNTASGRSFLRRRMVLIAASVAAVLWVLAVHPFLAFTRPVHADTLVVEGWVPDYVVARAARDFHSGNYRKVFVSGLELETGAAAGGESNAARTTRALIASGVPASLIETCPIASTSFNRTSHMARAVRDRMKALNHNPGGVNVVTLGPHARQTLLAYERMLHDLTPVGVISYPKNDYDPARWWASKAGIAKTTKDFAGWLKEVFFGLRS